MADRISICCPQHATTSRRQRGGGRQKGSEGAVARTACRASLSAESSAPQSAKYAGQTAAGGLVEKSMPARRGQRRAQEAAPGLSARGSESDGSSGHQVRRLAVKKAGKVAGAPHLAGGHVVARDSQTHKVGKHIVCVANGCRQSCFLTAEAALQSKQPGRLSDI